MSEKIKHRAGMAVLASSIAFALLVGGAIAWLFWPYPEITKSGDSVVVNTPENGVFVTGDLIRWTTPEICQPSGRTTATVYAVLETSVGENKFTVKTPLTIREFNIPSTVPECVKDNPTTAYVDGNLPTGVYRFEIDACVYNISPRPKCGVFQGPKNVRVERILHNE